MNMPLFGKRGFADVIKDLEMLSPGAVNLMASVIRHRREGHVKVGAEIGVTQPQAKEHLKLSEA